MKKLLLFILIILAFALFFIKWRIDERNLDIFMLNEYSKVSSIASASDVYFREVGFWPENFGSLLERYPELEEIIDNPSLYYYEPYSASKGFGQVSFSEAHTGVFRSESVKKSVAVRFPMNENREWNLKFKFSVTKM